MDKEELVQRVRNAAKLLEKLYGDSDHLKYTYLRYANTKAQLETNNKKALYAGVMTFLLLSGLVSNLRLVLRFSRTLWLALLGLIVILGIVVGITFSKRGQKRSEAEFANAKEDYESTVKPFLEQINASEDLKLIPQQYQYPIAANYIVNELESGTETVEAAIQKFEEYFDELAGRSNHEEFRKTKEESTGVNMFYPDLELQERVERASRVSSNK